MSQQSETVASLARIALYQLQISDAAKNIRKQYDQVALGSGTVAERAAHAAAAGLDLGDSDAETADAITALATLAENIAKMTNGGVVSSPPSLIDTSQDWLATMTEAYPSGITVTILSI